MRTGLTFVLMSVAVVILPVAALAQSVIGGQTISATTLSLGDGQKVFSAVDLNNDGYRDLIVAETSRNRLVVLLNNQGAFVRDGTVDVGPNPTSLAPLDFNRDQNSDLVVVNHEAPSLVLLKGDGMGGLMPAAQSPLPIETTPHSHHVEVADFNKDGAPDIIIDSRDAYGVFILAGTADGRFRAPGQGIDVGGRPYLGFTVADLNGDGSPDIATPNGNTIGILINRTTDTLAFERRSSLEFPSPFSVAVGDMNGDGYPDLIAASQSGEHGIAVFMGNGAGAFRRAASFPMRAGAKTVSTGDVNGDGLTDAAIANWNAELSLVLGRADGPTVISLPLNGQSNPWGPILSDLDGDGRDEIVTGDAGGSSVIVYTVKPRRDDP